MSFIRTLQPKLVAGALGLLAAAAGIAVAATSGRAQVAGATYVITPVGRETLAFTDVKPAGFRRNRFSLGDQIFLTTKIMRDHTVAGTEQATITVSDPRPVDGARRTGWSPRSISWPTATSTPWGRSPWTLRKAALERSSAAPGRMPGRAERSSRGMIATSCICCPSGCAS